jgi:putative PIN family toxin of toxin-antitoxin system
MRVVIDTNIFISSFFGGYPKRVIDLWASGRITLCLSNAVIEEYIDVLHRMDFTGTAELNELLELFKKQVNCIYASKTVSLNVCEDRDDDKFIEAAVTLKAKYIISGDKHLKSLCNYADILILSPRDFIEKQVK